jgi:hypothetical protein
MATELTTEYEMKSTESQLKNSTESTTEEMAQSSAKAVESTSKSSSTSIMEENVTTAEKTILLTSKGNLPETEETAESTEKATGTTKRIMTVDSEPREINEYDKRVVDISTEKSTESNSVLTAADAKEYGPRATAATSKGRQGEEDQHVGSEPTTGSYRLLTTESRPGPVTEDEGMEPVEDYDFPYFEPV